MKKKIKDLTLKECEKICDKHGCNRLCPLFIRVDENNYVQCIYELFENKRFEKEVEVDE